MVVLPSVPFTSADLERLGLSRHHLRELIASGQLRHPFRGVFCPGELPDTTETRARCAALVLPEHSVVCDRSAAWIHGVDVLDPTEISSVPRLEVVARRGNTRTRRPGVYGGERELIAQDICVVAGVRVTSPLRTACDLACLRGRYSALGVLDAFMREHDVTHADLQGILPRFRGRRGVVQLKQLAPIASPLRESMGESFCAGAIHDAGIPLPTPQVWVELDNVGRVRLDHAYERLKIAVEYDGEEFHSAAEDLERDRLRREALELAGWIVIVVRKGDFTGPSLQSWLARLQRAIEERQLSYRRVFPAGEPRAAHRRTR